MPNLTPEAKRELREQYERQRELAETARLSICSVCGGDLTIATNPKAGSDILICPGNRLHRGYRKRPTLSELHRRGYWIPYVSDRIEARRRKELEEQVGTTQAIELSKLATVPRITEDLATKIIKTIWPEAIKEAPTTVMRAIMVCHQYNLNPLLKHIYLIPFRKKDDDGNFIKGPNGKPVRDWEMVMSIEANREMAQRRTWYTYADGPRLMTPDEQLSHYGEEDKTKWRAITIVTDRDGGRYEGIAEISRSASVKGTDKGNSPQNMARIRSERQALAKLPRVELPNVEVIEGNYIDITPAAQPAAIGPSPRNAAPAAAQKSGSSTPIPRQQAPKTPAEPRPQAPSPTVVIEGQSRPTVSVGDSPGREPTVETEDDERHKAFVEMFGVILDEHQEGGQVSESDSPGQGPAPRVHFMDSKGKNLIQCGEVWLCGGCKHHLDDRPREHKQCSNCGAIYVPPFKAELT